MDDRDSFDAAVGRSIAGLRGKAGLTQTGLADALTLRGIGWKRSTVAQVETGRRAVSLAEALAVADVLRVALVDLLRLDRPVSVGLDGGVWHPKFVVAAAEGTTDDLLVIESYTSPERQKLQARIGGARVVSLSLEQAHGDRWPNRIYDDDLAAVTDVEEKTARRLAVATHLDITGADVVAAAAERWHRAVADERDERVRKRLKRGATARTVQAARGLVMRALDKELTEAIEAAVDRVATARPDASAAPISTPPTRRRTRR